MYFIGRIGQGGQTKGKLSRLDLASEVETSDEVNAEMEARPTPPNPLKSDPAAWFPRACRLPRKRLDQGMKWFPWALLSAVFAAATAVLAKLGVEGVDPNLATAIRTSVVLVFAWGVAALASPSLSLRGFSGRTWLFLALSGLATGLSWLCYFRALKLGPASRVAPVDKLSVVFVLVFAASFLGESLTWKTGLGAALITAGAVMLAWK